MGLTYGFFNSVNGDRLYNADQMSSMFEGLISDGIYEDVGDAYIVTASSGMNVQVGTGRALLNAKWAKNDAPVTLTLNNAHALLGRYTAIVLRLDVTGRAISLEMIDGTPASTPTKPSIVRNSQYFDLLLAYVYVGAGVTTITQANIEDQRANTTYCGWVTGIIEQVDTSELFLQWQTAYEQFYTTFTTAFEEWFEDLTQRLQVNTYITEYRKKVTLQQSDSRDIQLTGYTIDGGEVYLVFFNGLQAEKDTDWTISVVSGTPTIHVNMAGTGAQDVEIRILKSKIGDPVMQPLTYVVQALNENIPVNTAVTIE